MHHVKRSKALVFHVPRFVIGGTAAPTNARYGARSSGRKPFSPGDFGVFAPRRQVVGLDDASGARSAAPPRDRNKRALLNAVVLQSKRPRKAGGVCRK
jgi:hypothetical protein